MSVSFGLVYPLWNHTREPGGLLDRVVGEVGIDHLTIPVLTGPHEQFRLWWFPEGPYFHTEGGWHFQPQAKLYAKSGLKPHVARWVGTRRVLEEVCEEAARRGLKVHFSIDLAAFAPRVLGEPLIAQRNAWGEVYVGAHACLLNPSTRALLSAAVEDLSRCEAAALHLIGVEVEGALPVARRMTIAGIVDVVLQSMCFCPACTQHAAQNDVDAEKAAAEIIRIGRCLGGLHAQLDLLNSELERTPLLSRYIALRSLGHIEWMRGFVTSLAPRAVSLHDQPPAFGERRDDLVLSVLSAAQRDAVAQARAILEAATRMRVAAEPFTFGEDAAAALVTAVSNYAKRGAAFIDFGEVEQLRPEVVTWLKQAVRYARRG